MIKYFLKRTILAILSLIIILIMVYFLLGLTKSSPISPENYINNPEGYFKELEALGLDKPIAQRFVKYISDIFTGQGFGLIYRTDFRNLSIPELFFKPLTYTLWITIPAFLMASSIGIGLGILSGYKKGTWIDTAINIFVVTFIGIPSFVLAALALTSGQFLGLPTSFIRPEDGGYKQMLLSIILPILVMTLPSLAIYTYTARNEIITVLKSNQVTIARAKGLDEWAVFKKHVIRNASIPLVSLVLNSFLVMLVSSIVIETFFQIPGTSSIIISAVKNSEYNIVMFNTIFFVFLTLIIGIIIDIIFLFLDPRIKYQSVSEFKFIRILKAQRLRNNQLSEIKTLSSQDQKQSTDQITDERSLESLNQMSTKQINRQNNNHTILKINPEQEENDEKSTI